MKKAKLILWILFPLAIAVHVICVYSRIYTSLITANILTALIFLLPITAMLLQTLQNREKNLSKSYFIIKLAVVAYLYAMVLYFFITILIAY